MFNVLSGIDVIVSNYMQTFVEVPAKKHRGNERTSYSKRVQKKWNKKYGSSFERSYLTDGNRVFCNEINYEFLKTQGV